MSHGETNLHAELEKGLYHGHPNYLKVWVGLIILFAMSLAGGLVFGKITEIVFIFGIAIIKACMVGGYFMHLKWEPKFFTLILCFALLCLAFFFGGVYPDIVPIESVISK